MSYSLTKHLKPALLTMVSGAIAMVITGNSAQAQAVYKWQDAKGATHYTQTPPPVGAKSQMVEVKSRTNLQPLTITTIDATATNTGNKANPGTQATSSQQKPKLKQEDCQTLKSTLDTLNSGRRLYEADAKGERAYLTEEQRAERIQTYSKNLAEGCS